MATEQSDECSTSLDGVAAALKKGRFSEAASGASLILDRQPGFESTLVAFRAFVASDRFDEILDLLRRSSTTRELTATQCRIYSAEASVRGNQRLGLFFAIAAVALNQVELDYWVHLSSITCHEGFLHESLLAINRAIRIAPNFPICHRIRSAVLGLMGRRPEALEAAERAIELYPDAVDYRIHIAGLLLDASKPHQALFHLAVASAGEETLDITWRLVSAAYLSLGDFEAAIKAANRAAAYSEVHKEFRDNLSLFIPSESRTGSIVELSRGTEFFSLTASTLDEINLFHQRVGPSTIKALRNQLGVLWALMLREMRTMYSSSIFSYLWALFEPASHVALLFTIFVLIGHSSKPPLGDNMLVFYLSGLFPYLCFSHGTEKSMHAVSANINLLTISRITTLDIILSRIFLSLMTDLVVLIIVVLALSTIDFIDKPNNVVDMIIAYVLCWALTTGCGLICTVVSSYADWFEKIWPTFLRIQYFTCGIFYHPSGMPEWARDYLVLNPLLHILEYFRQGYFADYTSPYLSKTYLLVWCFGSLSVGLMLERLNRGRLRQHT